MIDLSSLTTCATLGIHSGYKTTLIETWSLYNDRRPLMDHLKEALEKEGFQLKPRNLEEVYKKIVETGKDKYIIIFQRMSKLKH